MKTFSRFAVALLVLATLLSNSSATILAQSDSTVQPAQTEQAPPPEAPTEAPLPTEIPSTEIPPTEVPPTLPAPPTATSTVIPTPTVEPTSTATSVPTESPTPTATPSPTPSPTPTATPTQEPQFSAAAEVLTLSFSPPSPVVGVPFTAQAVGSIQLLGDIVYTSWDGPGCTGTATVGSSQPIVLIGIPASAPRTFNTPGTKSFRAQTTVLSLPKDNSPCTNITVKATPTVTVAMNPNPVNVGTPITAQATLSGASGVPTGSVTYAVFSDNICTVALATPINSTVTISGGVIPPSGTGNPTIPAIRYVKATYAPGIDPINSAATSACTPFTILGIPTLAVAFSPTSVTVGGSTVATATLTAAGAAAGGNVTYAVFSNAGCSTGIASAINGTKPVTNAVVPNSSSGTFATPGTYYVKATYSGDALNNAASSTCSSLTVAKASPTLTVTPLATAVIAGSTSTASSTLTGGFGPPTGTVVYGIYPTSACGTATTLTAALPLVSGAPPVSSAVVMNLINATTTATNGTLYWKVVYSGDANNNTATSSCASKTVTKKTTTLSHTDAPTTATTAVGITRTSTLSGSVLSAGGSVTWTVFSDTVCSTAMVPALSTSKNVTNGTVPTSDPILMPTAGTRSINAAYSGDNNNTASSGPCRTVTVSKATPNVALEIAPTTIVAGATATGAATLTNKSPTAGGNLVYRVYTDVACTIAAVPAKTSTVTVVNGAAPISSAFTFATGAQFYWRAEYAGDVNNNLANSACTSFIVKSAPSLSVAFSPPAINAGGSAVATSTLTGATAAASGTVTYATYSNATCTNNLATGINGDKTVTNAVVPNSNAGTFTLSGTFYVKATYTGDTLNNSATSGCAALTVAKLTPTLTMSQSPNPVAVGGSFGYGFSLTGTTGAATGTVTLQLFTSNTCGTPISGQSFAMTVAGSAVPGSPSITYAFPGTVYARASYGGDTNHNSATTACTAVGLATGSMSASLSNATFNPLPYSNTAQVNSGQLVLTVTDPRGTAAGWSVSIVAGPFVYSGTAIGQSSIPASNFALTSTGAPTTVSGQPIGAGGPTATGATGALSTSRTVVIASPGYGSGTYNQIVNVNLTIPGTSKAGTYTSTMTVTTAAAP